jgi:release factor glutamine methyltransferase
MYISKLISIGSETLKKNNVSTHLLDSELLISNTLKKSRESILTSLEEKVSIKNISAFKKLIERRVKKEPMAYILKKKEFWSKNFFVNIDTLIPRPETEILVEKIVKHFKSKETFVLDIGTGSGCIIIALMSEMNKSRGIGIDISKKAINIARYNTKKLGLNSKIKFYNRNLDQIFGFKFDIIVSNPPYICSHQIKNLSDDIKKYEPRIALDGGNDGLDVIKKVIYKSNSILKRKGILALEIGRGQYKKVSKILKLQGYKEKYLIKDYQNNIRCIMSVLDSN